ncbi:hypothetical protein FQA39_LY16865 [Lamprigera yunnana]|nr:hypothetical protein FQA39_LY16865 [Lamprigera yunnana]
MKESTFSLLFFVGTCLGLKLPPDFRRCRRTDSNTDLCLKNAIQSSLPVLAKGLPEFDVDSIDPIRIPSLTIGEGKGAVQVIQYYKNVEIHNIKSIIMNNVKSDIKDDGFSIVANGLLKNCVFEADYNLNGNILVVPITGNGTCTITLVNTKVTFDITAKVFTRNEKEYLEIKRFDVSLEPEKAEYNFRNLFNGDPTLGDTMNKILNDNWKDVLDDVKTGYEEALSIIFRRIANLIFKKVPLDEIF